jgi:hypothetical protein
MLESALARGVLSSSIMGAPQTSESRSRTFRRTSRNRIRGTGPKESDALEVEPLLPSQYLDRILPEVTIQPEKRLMLAVLESAVAAYQRFALATSRRGRRLFGETQDWFSAADESWPFSFEVICSGLSIDAGFLRKGLRRWHEQAVASATPGPARTPFRRVNARRHKVSGRAAGLESRTG